MQNHDPRPPQRRSLVEEITDLDQELLHLLARRCRLVAKTRRPKKEGVGTDEVNSEKKIRLAWERAASRFSGDQHMVRRLFSLLQELDLAPRMQEETPADFNLAPQQRPVAVDIAGPGSAAQLRAWIALGAAAKASICIGNAVITDPVVDLVKALNQCGARLSWEGDSILSKEGPGLAFTDKVIFAGDEAFTVYLLAFLALPTPGTAKFTGGGRLKLADFTPLRHILPPLGARIAHIVPKSNGLPLRIESAGMIPDTIVVPDDLPQEGLSALILAASTWGRATCIELEASPHRQTVTHSLLPILHACGADITWQDTTLCIGATPLQVPDTITLDMDPLLASYILAIPAFTQGWVRLDGHWSSYVPHADSATALLEASGLALENGPTSVRSASVGPCAFDAPTAHKSNLAALPEELQPLALTLAARQAATSGACTLPGLAATLADDPVFAHGAEDFIGRLGLTGKGDCLEKPHTKPAMPAPWTCPSPWWALAYALAAFKRPFNAGLRLANPGVITDIMPAFWLLYNGLPSPDMQRKPKEPPHADKPTRRRIITG